ncbi:MAG TPA: hypothetical protein VEL07_11545 [Planctomycetota bacterium]|nr:hypothetical protein [Planctomycetota bacterium]
MAAGVDSLLLVVPTADGWEVVDAYCHHPPEVFAVKGEALAWVSDEAYRRFARVVVCDVAFDIESDFAWDPPGSAGATRDDI